MIGKILGELPGRRRMLDANAFRPRAYKAPAIRISSRKTFQTVSCFCKGQAVGPNTKPTGHAGNRPLEPPAGPG